MIRLAAGSLIVATLLTAWPSVAGAVDSVESGWWWREQPADGSLPPPPHVPAGGLRVASDATGPSAVSAVRIALAAGEGDAVLTLKVAGGSAEGVAVNACPVKATWKPVGAGAWTSRPEPDCSGGAVVGSVDGATMAFDLSTLDTGDSGVVDVVLFTTPQPLPVVPASPPPTVDVAFAKPVAADVAVRTIPSTDAPTTSEEPLADGGAAVPAFESGAGPAASFETALDSPSFDLPAPPAPAPPARPGETVAPRPGDGTSEVVASPLQRVVEEWDRVGEARDRLLAAFVFVDLLAVWWFLERRRRQPTAGDDGRPRISLHDDPTAVLAAHAARRSRRPPVPTVDVPPLR